MRPIEALATVSKKLQPLEIDFAFLGGAIIYFLVDEPELIEFRPTKDVDVIVEVVTRVELAGLEERLRKHGFQHDMEEGVPICRWKVEACTVDIMPIDDAVLGMNSRWFPEALQTAEKKTLMKRCQPK